MTTIPPNVGRGGAKLEACTKRYAISVK